MDTSFVGGRKHYLWGDNYRWGEGGGGVPVILSPLLYHILYMLGKVYLPLNGKKWCHLFSGSHSPLYTVLDFIP